MRRYGREKGRELTLPFFWEATSGVGNDLWGSLFRLPVGLAAASDERKIFCFQVEQSSGNFLTKTKKFIFLVEIPFEILPTITNKSSFLVEHKEMNFIGELMKAVHKEMALIGKPMKAARWGPIGVPILILCYSIG